MKSFSIFPHKGYLNTDFQIQIFDGETRSFYIDQGTVPLKNVLSFRLSAGKHQIKSVVEGSGQYNIEIDEVEVEDAVRLGSSRLEAGYCFGNSPWIAVVMKDRTYFFNTNTGDNYIENGLSPVKIMAINERLFLLNYGQKDNYGTIHTMEYCVYDVSCGEVVGQFEKFIFLNSDIAVFSDTSTDGTLCLSVIWHHGDYKIQTIQCKSYTIIDEILYYCCINDDKYKVVKLQSDGTGVELPYCSGAKDNFLGFILNHYYLHQSSRHFYLKDIIEPNNYIGVPIHNYGGVIRKINEIEVAQSGLVEDFYALVTGNMALCSKLDLHVDILDLTLFENSDGIYTKVTHNKYEWWDYNYKRPYTWSELSMNCVAEQNKIGVWDNIYISDNILIVKSNESIKIFNKGKCVRDLSGVTVYETPKGNFIYAKREEEIVEVYKVNVSEDELIIRGNEKDIQLSFVERYGILTENSKNYRVYYIDDSLWQHMAHQKYVLEEKNHQCFLRDTDVDGQCYLLREKLHPIGLPISINSILSVTNNGSIILSQSPRGIIIHERNNDNLVYEINENLLDIIDTCEYQNALFSDDGNHTIYCKKGIWYYYDIITGAESVFEMEPGIAKRQRRGLYSLNFYAHFYNDTKRRIVLVDPISLQKIAPGFLCDYTFISPSGRLASNTHIAGVNRRFFLKSRKDKTKEIVFKQEVTEILSSEETRLLDKKIQHFEIAFPGSAKEEWEKELIDLLINRVKMKKNDGEEWCLYARKYALIDIFYTDKEKDVIRVELPENLGYLNSIVFSHDDRYVSICGKTILGKNLQKGFIGVYDLKSRDWIFGPETPNLAVWKSFFSMSGMFAYYDSKPHAKCGKLSSLEDIDGRSILSFSRSGKYMAMSDKGYIPFSVNTSSWGHMKSANIYVRKVGENKELHFFDHGDEIKGLYNSDVTSVSFSPDDKKLMSISQDGVIIIRNLHLEELQEEDEITKSQRGEIRKMLEETDEPCDPSDWLDLMEKYYYEGKGIFYTKDQKKIIACTDDTMEEYCVKDGCEVICDEAFGPCIPSYEAVMCAEETKTEVSYGNKLSIISLPPSVNQIGKDAFSFCENLKEIRVPFGCLDKFKKMISPEHWDKLVEV